MRLIPFLALATTVGLTTPALAQVPDLPGNPFLDTPSLSESPSGPGSTPGFPSTPGGPGNTPGFPTPPGGPGSAPTLPNQPTQVPLDGGLVWLALAGGAYAAKRLRGRRDDPSS